MVRPQLGLGNAFLEFAELKAEVRQESHHAVPVLAWSDLSESEQRLLAMLAVTVLGLTLRAAIIIWKACKSQTVVKGATDVDVKHPSLFLGKVYVDVAMKVGATMGHGWMAVKWILAGEPASAVLVTSLLLVAVNTQMLVTVVQIAHLRNLLLKLGITKNVRLKFTGVGNLLRVGAGRSCVAVNVVATSLLVVHLKERMFQLITWLLTALGTVMWANATLEGIGSSAWNDIKEFATADAGTMDVEDFLDELEAEKDPEQGRTCSSCPLMSHIVDMSKEDQLLLKNHALLLHHAFPSLPRLRFVHGVMFMLLNLCCFAVPAALLGLCYLEVPRLQGISLDGGTLHPSKLSRKDDNSHYYISLQDGWKADILLTFELRVGQAASFEFCCTSGCSRPKDSEHGDTLLLTSNITASNFGTCNLKLYGMRFRQYDFTILALQGLEISSSFGTATGSVQPFDVHLKNYNISFTSQEKEESNLTLDVAPQVERNIKVRYDARSCFNQSCTASQWQPAVGGGVAMTELIEVEDFNLTVWITLSPASSKVDVKCVYQIVVEVIDLKTKLEGIALKMSALESRQATLEEFGDQVDKTLQDELKNLVLERDHYLRQAYDAQQIEENSTGTSHMLTFMAVGLTGTGKSELCHWMTGDKEHCSPSGSMQSDTSRVQEVIAHPFNDQKMWPMIKWVDTPGRGDTKGDSEDKAMWDRTMLHLVEKLDQVDRIVWIINAAWQRGTALRQMIHKELRRSFGVHLYRHLDLVFNFLPHPPNKTEYDTKKLWPQRVKFIQWLGKQEMEQFNWNSDQWQGVEEELNRTGFYGVNIDPKFMEDLPHGLPLSAPYLDWFQPFSHPAGVRELFRFYKTAKDDRQNPETSDPLRLRDRHPPMGPGKLQRVVPIGWKCGFVPSPEEDGFVVT